MLGGKKNVLKNGGSSSIKKDAGDGVWVDLVWTNEGHYPQSRDYNNYD